MIIKRIATVAVTSAAALAMIAAPALAAVTFDTATGTGFSGKGDVQLTFNWNNKQLNENASKVAFAYEGVVVTELVWECTNSKNEKLQERERTTRTSLSGLVSHIARDNKKQITGFNLTGFNGDKIEKTQESGQKLNSCPEGNDWALTTPAGEPELVSETGGVKVSNDSGATYVDFVVPVL